MSELSIFKKSNKNVVVIGGGTGSYTVLSGLKNYPINITSIVTVADSGGSTGKLRDEFGYLPVGDFRMALVALAGNEEEQALLRKLMLYRFEKGEISGLKGHNFGNLFLVGLAEALGSVEEALIAASKILNIKGRVLPITNTPVELVAEYVNGAVIRGETYIDEPPESHDKSQKIINLYVEPKTPIGMEAMGAILEADLIVLGPGDLYTSILANLVIEGVGNAVKKSSATVVYISNLMTKFGQTHELSASQHVSEISKYLGKLPDYVICNVGDFPAEVLEHYSKQKEFPVVDDLEEGDFKVVRAHLLSHEMQKKSSSDKLKRSLIRHNSDRLAWELIKILNDEFYEI